MTCNFYSHSHETLFPKNIITDFLFSKEYIVYETISSQYIKCEASLYYKKKCGQNQPHFLNIVLNITKNYLFTLFAASMKPWKSGCGRFGRDLSSGCACVAINHGCSGISIISTILPSGDVPQSFMPCSVRAVL